MIRARSSSDGEQVPLFVESYLTALKVRAVTQARRCRQAFSADWSRGLFGSKSLEMPFLIGIGIPFEVGSYPHELQ